MNSKPTVIYPQTWYRSCARHSVVLDIASRPHSLIGREAVKIDAIFFPVIAVVIQFFIPSASLIIANVSLLSFDFYRSSVQLIIGNNVHFSKPFVLLC